MPKMFDIVRYCQQKECERQIRYKQMATGGNDPTITNKIRYSQYVKNAKPRQTQVTFQY